MTTSNDPLAQPKPMTLEQLEAYRKEQAANGEVDDKRHETIMRGIEDEMRDLQRIEEDSINTIPELNFVHVFLPFFAGDEVNPYNVDLSNWLTVAGSPYRPVNIANDKGEVIYQVPAIIGKHTLSPKTHSPQDSIFELLTNANQMTSISPRRGAAYFREHLTKVHTGLMDKTVDIESIRQWNAIFKRYGRELIMIQGLEAELNTEPKSVAPKGPDFNDVEFDLL